MKIRDDLITVHPNTRSGQALPALRGVVVHWTEWPGTDAQELRDYFNTLPQTEPDSVKSAHYVVGLDGEIIRMIPEDETAWHAGPSDETFPEIETLLGGLPNWRTIGVEMCHPTVTGEFYPATLRAGAELAADILYRNGITERERVLRHHDCTGKDCPRWMIDNGGEWTAFQNVFDAYRSALEAAGDGGGSPGGPGADAKAIATSSAILAYRAPVTGTPAVFTGAPSAALMADGRGVYMDGAAITIPAGITDGACVASSPTNATLPATAAKVVSGGKLPIREGDEVTVGGIAGVTGSGSSCTLSVTVFVQRAGQTKVTAG